MGKWGCEREISVSGFGCDDVETVMIVWVQRGERE